MGFYNWKLCLRPNWTVPMFCDKLSCFVPGKILNCTFKESDNRDCSQFYVHKKSVWNARGLWGIWNENTLRESILLKTIFRNKTLKLENFILKQQFETFRFKVLADIASKSCKYWVVLQICFYVSFFTFVSKIIKLLYPN